MEAPEEEAPSLAPPQPSKLGEELSLKTQGNQSGDMDSYNLTILHFNDVYDVDSSTEEPVGGAARCGPPSFLSDLGGGMEGGNLGNQQEGLEGSRESFVLTLWSPCSVFFFFFFFLDSGSILLLLQGQELTQVTVSQSNSRMALLSF